VPGRVVPVAVHVVIPVGDAQEVVHGTPLCRFVHCSRWVHGGCSDN
jgi:hypothetical protein